MSKLAMATLARLQRKRPTELEGQPIEVQFNPTSLRIQRSNNQDVGGIATRTQRRQHSSVQNATLSFDLEFDTAEEQSFTQQEGTATGRPVDVRTCTAAVRQFVEPDPKAPTEPPPRVRFQWGTFVFNGMVTQLTEDLDYFAADGTPLRAKLSLTITEQDLKFEANASGPGARSDQAATEPGGQPDRSAGVPPPGTAAPPGATPGRSGTNDVRRVLPAVAGESVQQLAVRAGGDPAAWRSLMNRLQSPLTIPAGTPVDVGPELEAAGTVGRAAGFAAGTDALPSETLARVLGLSAAAPAGTGVPLPASSGPAAAGAATAAEAAGFALSAAGGIAGATSAVLADLAGRAVAAARTSFAVPPPVAVRVEESLDPRALSYGRAIPLRARAESSTLAALQAGGRRSLAARARPAEVPVSTSAGRAPWEQLPPAASGRAASDRAQRNRDARPSTIRWRPGGECS